MFKRTKYVIGSLLLFSSFNSALAMETELEVPSPDESSLLKINAATQDDSVTKLQKLCVSGQFEAKFDSAFTKREDQLNKRRDLVDQSVEKRRALRDQQRIEKDTEITSALSEKKPERLSVYENFKAKVDSAISARRSGVNQSLSTFRSTVNSINNSTKSAITSEISALKSSACADGASQDQIKAAWEQFQAKIKRIRVEHQSAKVAARKVLKTANQQNLANFKTTLESAQTERKNSLKELRQ